MKNREKVIKALRCCVMDEEDPCDGACPYAGETDCVYAAMTDALAVLEGAEPGGCP